MNDIHWCIVCGQRATELHHRVYRSECKPLEHCKINLIYLCREHHRGTYGVHGKYGDKLNKTIKLQLQNYLEMIFDKELLTRDEINEVLNISERSLERLLKILTLHKGKYARKDVIRACMGGKMITGDVKK